MTTVPTIFEKLKSKLEDTDLFLSQMGVDIVDGKTLDEAVYSAMHSYLHNWKTEESTAIYVDDIISIKVTEDAYSTIIVVDNGNGTFTTFVNDTDEPIKKFEGVEDVSFNPDTLEVVLTNDGEEVYNFRPPTEETLTANDIVGYIIHPDGRITYYMGDGSCQISHEFEYNDGVIEYIECLICGDLVTIQIRFFNYRWHDQYNLIYYDNYIETTNFEFTWYNEFEQEFLLLPMQLYWYKWYDDFDMVYYDNYEETMVHGFSYQDFQRPEFEEEKGLNYRIEKEYSTTKQWVLFEYPVFWQHPVIEGCVTGVGDGGGPSSNSPSWDGAGGGVVSEVGKVDEPEVEKRPPPPEYEKDVIINNPENPILPVKKPIEKVLGCQRDSEALYVTFGDRKWTIPFRFMDISTIECDTRNFSVRIDENGMLLLELPGCNITYPLGTVTEFDGKDGITTQQLIVNDNVLTQELVHHDGEVKQHTVLGEIKFPHVKEALISDKQELVLRNDNGDYTVTQAKYPNNNGNMGMFPVFSNTIDENGKYMLVGKYYYPDTAYSDTEVIVDLAGSLNDKDRHFDIFNNFLRFHVNGEVSVYELPEIEIYRGVTDIQFSNDNLVIEYGYNNIIESNNKLSTTISEMEIINDKLSFTLNVGDNTETVQLDLPFDINEIDGEDGNFLFYAVKSDGVLGITPSDDSFDFNELVDVQIPDDIISIELDSDLLYMSRTSFMINNIPHVMFQDNTNNISALERNWIRTGYTTAFHGREGQVFSSGRKTMDGAIESLTLLNRFSGPATIENYGRDDFVTDMVIEDDNSITIHHFNGKRINFDFPLIGKDADYLNSVFNIDDSIYIEWVTGQSEFLGFIRQYEGKEPKYPTEFVLSDTNLNVSMPTGTIEVDITDVVGDRGSMVKSIEYNNNHIIVEGTNNDVMLDSELILDGKDADLITDITRNGNTPHFDIHVDNVEYPIDHHWFGVDTGIPETLCMSDEGAILYFTNNSRIEIEWDRHYHGQDGQYITSIVYSDNMASLVTNYTTLPLEMKIDGVDGISLVNIEYDTELRYTLSDGTTRTINGPDGILDGEDAVYISDVDFTDRAFSITYSDDRTETLLDNIDGIETTVSIENILIDNSQSLVFIHKDGSEVKSLTPLDTNHVASNNTGNDLTIEFKHDVFTFTDLEGTDVADGVWVSGVSNDATNLIVELSDGSSETLGVFDTYEIEDITVDTDGKLVIQSNKENYISERPVIAPTPLRSLETVELVDYNLTLTFDTEEVWSAGNVRGEDSTSDLTSMYLEDGKLFGTINNTNIIGDVEIDGNFGFEEHVPSKEYSVIDSVVFDQNLYVLLGDSTTETPLINDDWGRVQMVDEDRSIVFAPRAISPINTTVTNKYVEFKVTNISTIYTNINLRYRQFQVITEGGDWTIPLVDETSPITTHISEHSFADGVYYWRSRDYVDSQSSPSAWSTPVMFTVLNDNTLTPVLSLLDNSYTLTPSFEIIYEGSYNFFEIKCVNEKGTELFFTHTESVYIFDLGILETNTNYNIHVRAVHNGQVSGWSDPLSYTTGNDFDVTVMNPVIYGDETTISTQNPFFKVDYSGNEIENILRDAKCKAEWVLEDITGNVLWRSVNEIDLTSSIISSPLIEIGISYQVKMRYVNNYVNSAWSNIVSFTALYSLETPITSVTPTNDPFIYEIKSSISPNEGHIQTSWEFIDANSNVVLYVDRSSDYLNSFDSTKFFHMINETMYVRSKHFNYFGNSSDWSEWVDCTITVPDNSIMQPSITDYFVHDFGLVYTNNELTEPEIVQYEVRSTISESISTFESETINGISAKTVKVAHNNFSSGVIYYMKARQFHTMCGWSEWSSEEMFGYDFKTGGGVHEIIIPEGIDTASIVAVGAGRPATYANNRKFAGGGASLTYNNHVTLSSSLLPVTVGSSRSSSLDRLTTIGNFIDSNKIITYYNDDFAHNDGGASGSTLANEFGGGGAAGYIGNGGKGGAISPTGESGSGGYNSPGGKGGGVSILGSTVREMRVGESGGAVYSGIPTAGGGAGASLISSTRPIVYGDDGGVGILYGILKFPLGVTAPWADENQ